MYAVVQGESTKRIIGRNLDTVKGEYIVVCKCEPAYHWQECPVYKRNVVGLKECVVE